jgi:RNA polymerase subunit RPABC4/transcription elongation factor Spt4
MHELSPDGISWQPADSMTDFFGQRTEQQVAYHQTNTDADMGNTVQQPPPEEPQWYANLNNEQKGPVTKDQLGQWVASGAITQETLVWQEGTENWVQASVAISEFFYPAASDPAQAPTDNQPGDMKNCPFCTQVINFAAVKCPHCESMLNNFCSNCGTQCSENQAVCLNCGTGLANGNEPAMVAQPVSSVVASPAIVAQDTNLATISMVLSFIGLFCFGIILCPIALILAIVAMNKGEKNAVAALIISIVIFIPSVILFFAILGGM